MSFRNRRRSLSSNSSILLQRRSSINSKDIEYVQNALQRTKKLSNQLILFAVITSPIFIFCYQASLHSINGYWSIDFSLMFNNPITSTLFFQIFCLKAWIFVLLLVQIQLLFLWYIPAVEKEDYTIQGQKCFVRQNSFDSCIIFCLLYIIGGLLRIYPGDFVFVEWNRIMFVLTILSMVLQAYLHIHSKQVDDGLSSKGSKKLFRNNLDDNLICEIFFGRSLQPIIFHIDIKAFITHRIMYTIWALYIISTLWHQRLSYEHVTSGLIITSLLQFCHVFRQLWFEYLRWDLDNQTDRAGFYRLWGYMVFLPTLYLTPITLLAQTNKKTSNGLCTVIFLIGLTMQYLNTKIDLQKYEFRSAEGQWKCGECKDPFYILAKYRKDNGETGTELLLGSGYWGIARHLNYLTELLTVTFWTVIAAQLHVLAIFPIVFLTALLYGRMHRDETRCLIKYNQYWLQYIAKVPYLIIPGIY